MGFFLLANEIAQNNTPLRWELTAEHCIDRVGRKSIIEVIRKHTIVNKIVYKIANRTKHEQQAKEIAFGFQIAEG